MAGWAGLRVQLSARIVLPSAGLDGPVDIDASFPYTAYMAGQVGYGLASHVQ